MKKRSVKGIEVGAGILAGIAGAVAAGYMLYENTKPQQRKAKAWILKARTEAAKQMKVVKHMKESDYQRIMSTALKHYGAMQKVGVAEITSAMKDAKIEWKRMQAHGKKLAGSPRKSQKPATKKASKKKPTTQKKVFRKK